MGTAILIFFDVSVVIAAAGSVWAVGLGSASDDVVAVATTREELACERDVNSTIYSLVKPHTVGSCPETVVAVLSRPCMPMMVCARASSGKTNVPFPETQSQRPLAVSGLQHHFPFPQESNSPLF